MATRSDPAESAFITRFRKAIRLNGPGSEKDTRHVVLDVDEAAVFEAGDSLGIVAFSSPQVAAGIIERLGAAADTPVMSPEGSECPLAEALVKR